MAMARLGCVTIHTQIDDALDGSYNGIGFGATGWVLTLALLVLISELAVLLLHFLNPSWFNNYYVVFGGIVRKTVVCYDFKNAFTA